MNLFILDKNYNKIGILSNQGANPIAPFFDDVYTQELDTGADTYEFSTVSTCLTQELMEVGNHIIFEYNNEHKLFVIADIEFSHKKGMNTIDVYAEGIGFELLEKYKDAFEIEGSFKNLLNIILVGTGWKNEVGSKVTAIRKMKYDGEKNTLAIIQDAIKEYDGVEVKFEVDYSDSIIKKKVRVFPNGGRGSHIGHRFEYGVNVNGITKKEQIADSKDDTIIYNDNEVGILVSYDVDVAMRSEEIAQLNIGDTHYVIDHDFNPPITITARVGKLEISFSDPTKNKVTLSNFKGATGAISNKTHKGDVSNITQAAIDDYSGHEHDQYALVGHTHESSGGGAGSNNNLMKSPRMHSYEFLLYTNLEDRNGLQSIPRYTHYSNLSNSNPTISKQAIYDYLVNKTDVKDVSYKALDTLQKNIQGASTVSAQNHCLRLTPNDAEATKSICNFNTYTTTENTDYTKRCTMNDTVSSRIFSYIMEENDKPNFDINGYQIYKEHNDRHMLDVGSLACGLVAALQYHAKEVPHEGEQFYTVDYEGIHYYFDKGIYLKGSGYELPLLVGAGSDGNDIKNARKIECDYLYGTVNPSSDKSLKENIRYIDAPTTYSNEDLLEKADLYDFIVNQVSLCEYNFIGKDRDNIGFIANDYEGTKVGDKIVNRDEETDLLSYDMANLLFATIGALQEEVRTKDEKIASLEDRLARIEAILGITNNDNK